MRAPTRQAPDAMSGAVCVRCHSDVPSPSIGSVLKIAAAMRNTITHVVECRTLRDPPSQWSGHRVDARLTERARVPVVLTVRVTVMRQGGAEECVERVAHAAEKSPNTSQHVHLPVTLLCRRASCRQRPESGISRIHVFE